MPTLTLAAEPANLPPRIRLDVNATADTGAVDVLVTRTNPDNKVSVVRLADPALLASGLAVIFDYEMPYGANVTYTATSRNSSGTTLATTSAATSVASSVPWLVHPGVPVLSLPLPSIKTLGDRTRKVNQGVFEPYGRADPIVTTDGRRKRPTGQMMVRTKTLAERDALLSLVDDTATLLLQIPASLAWGVTSEYVAVGDLTEAREQEVGDDPYRMFTAPYIVVSMPAGGSQSQRTYSTVLAESATYQAILSNTAKYPTYLALLAPTA